MWLVRFSDCNFLCCYVLGVIETNPLSKIPRASIVDVVDNFQKDLLNNLVFCCSYMNTCFENGLNFLFENICLFFIISSQLSGVHTMCRVIKDFI